MINERTKLWKIWKLRCVNDYKYAQSSQAHILTTLLIAGSVFLIRESRRSTKNGSQTWRTCNNSSANFDSWLHLKVLDMMSRDVKIKAQCRSYQVFTQLLWFLLIAKNSSKRRKHENKHQNCLALHCIWNIYFPSATKCPKHSHLGLGVVNCQGFVLPCDAHSHFSVFSALTNPLHLRKGFWSTD